MSKLKTFGIVSLILGLITCLVIDIWYLWVLIVAPDKAISTTFEVGLQQTIDGNTKYFMEVNSYDNCFEVKFNYMLDENQESFYSQGIQYYHSDKEIAFRQDSILKKTETSENIFGWKTDWFDSVNTIYSSVAGTDRTNYMSNDDYANCLISTNPIDDNTYFKIQLNDNLYLMKFKGKVKVAESVKNKEWWYTYYTTNFINYDVDRLNGLIWSGISSLAYGTTHSIVFEFGDMFEYFYPTKLESGEYEPVVFEDMSKIVNDVKSYYSIKVTKHDGKILKSSESLFNCVNGNSNFNLSGIESADYFFGRTTINVGNSSFRYIVVEDNSIALKLKDEFIEEFSKYGELIQLKVLINLDELKSLGLEFVGFTSDNNLAKFDVLSCETLETIDGELVYMGVSYD